MMRPYSPLLLQNTEDTSVLTSPKLTEQRHVHSYRAILMLTPTIITAANNHWELAVCQARCHASPSSSLTIAHGANITVTSI